MMHQQMNQKKTTRREIEYILGHSPDELRRLMLQADVLRPTTERLLREAGLRQGMRVLDLGCGAGDVAMLAADLVGPSGHVVGIDRSAEALDLARDRARGAGYANIEFHQGAAEDFADLKSFDLAIGRYVLIHQADPANFIRAAASHVKPGGAVAFHEIAVYGELRSLPEFPLWRQAGDWAKRGLSSVILHPDAGGRMMVHFADAGLKPPKMFCEVPVSGGPDSPFYSWLALTIRSLLRQIEKVGLATAEEIDIDTLEQRMRETACALRTQLLMPMQFCGWSSI
jgi:2-polyprenyl-3-methyl-5-hydroxy-6-metoxy-1,4-benzoquinol methylase